MLKYWLKCGANALCIVNAAERKVPQIHKFYQMKEEMVNDVQ